MAIYHLSLKAIQRSKGRSATASAAYRSRARITDNRTGKTYDFSRRKGVEESLIFTPDNSPISRADLWNMAEAAERRKDGITAREYELALPSELDAEGRKNLTKNFCVFLMKKYGVAVDAALHAPTREGDQRNFHAHVMVTTRRYSAGKLLEKTDFDLSGRDLQKKGLKSQKEQLEEIRAEWEELVNNALEASGIQQRISHKSHEDRGIRAIPTVHMGVAATAMERKGIATDRGELNRRPVLRRLYSEFIQVKKEIRRLDAELSQMRQKREAENEQLRPAANHNPDKRHTERGREPESIFTSPVKANPSKETTRSGFPAPTTNVGSKRPVQPDKITVGGPEKFKEQPGRAGESHRSPRERPEIACGGFKSDSQCNGRIFTKRPSRGFRSGRDCRPESDGSGRSGQPDMGSSGEVGKTHWLDQLEVIKNILIERIIEYRTITDLLTMKKGVESDPQEEEKADQYLEGPK